MDDIAYNGPCKDRGHYIQGLTPVKTESPERMEQLKKEGWVSPTDEKRIKADGFTHTVMGTKAQKEADYKMMEDLKRNPTKQVAWMMWATATPEKRRETVIKEIQETLEKKDGAYKNSPIDELPTETWLHQIRIKAERALQAKDPEKRKDELMDCAIYCILALTKEWGK
jgi:hypothetical protein